MAIRPYGCQNPKSHFRNVKTPVSLVWMQDIASLSWPGFFVYLNIPLAVGEDEPGGGKQGIQDKRAKGWERQAEDKDCRVLREKYEKYSFGR